MRGKFALAIAILFALASSSQTAGGAKSEAQKEFEEDPSNLSINSGRWAILIERSNAGLDLLEKSDSDLPYNDARFLFYADSALKEDAILLLQLRNRLLHLGLVKPADVKATRWPAWIFEPPTSKESPDTLTARLDWIETEADKLVEIGCEIGRKKSDDTLFCSVE